MPKGSLPKATPPKATPPKATLPNASQRRARCLEMGLQLDGLDAVLAHDGVLASVVSSRLGHDVSRHRKMARHLSAAMQRFRADGLTVLVAKGTAIEPWVIQAADRFSVPTLVLEKTDDRDLRLMAIADRVNVVYSRAGGKIERLIRQRCELESGTVRVAVNSQTDVDLLSAGAVGSYLPREHQGKSTIQSVKGCSVSARFDSVDWSDFLVHCTRSAPGSWPGQTITHYRDDMLLGDSTTAARDAGAALVRIVRQRRLIASAVASSHRAPVVCFSEVPLPELLGRRTYRSHLHRWDYEPYGIAIRKSAARRLGMQPCVYGPASMRDELSADQRYRFQSIGSQEDGAVDWSEEKEWRSSTDVDLDQIDPRDVCVFAGDGGCAALASAVNHRSWMILKVS